MHSRGGGLLFYWNSYIVKIGEVPKSVTKNICYEIYNHITNIMKAPNKTLLLDFADLKNIYKYKEGKV